MEIRILQTLAGARRAEGLAVVIDVFRAFTLEAYLYAKGVAAILPVGSEETARVLKQAHPDYILIGERGGKILPGFDFGNSPSQTEKADLVGKTVIHTTSAGTQGLLAASGADAIITGSLVNARAIAAYIKKQKPRVVSLCCMGLEGKEETPEDTLCAEYIRSLLLEEPFDLEGRLKALRFTDQGMKFFDPATQEVFPMADYRMSTDADRFDFVIQVYAGEKDSFRTVKQDMVIHPGIVFIREAGL